MARDESTCHGLILEDVDLFTPYRNHLLIRDVSMELKKVENLIIVGNSGALTGIRKRESRPRERKQASLPKAGTVSEA
jgi:hypothetical protein